MTTKIKDEQFVQVEVITVSGSYPENSHKEVPIHQKVRLLLEKASDKLGIVSTDGFVATVDGQEIDINLTYEGLGLTGKVTVDWSKREGGGGNA